MDNRSTQRTRESATRSRVGERPQKAERAKGDLNDGRTRGGDHSRSEQRTRGEQHPRSEQHSQDEQRVWRPPIVAIVGAVVALAAILFMGRICSQAASITVSVNGTEHTIRGDKTMQVAIKESGLPINPGDYISLGGNILQRSDGYPFYATVNGEETADPDFRLREGDVIVLQDGKDRVEEYDATESPVEYGMSIVGLGAIHLFTEGVPGVLETRTGRDSGEVVEKQVVDPTNASEVRHDPDVGDEKIVALTFDDGPSTLYTGEILDILADNDAKATFFFRGIYVETGGADLVLRAYEDGHQICTHSYDNGGSGDGTIADLSVEEQREEVTKGYKALSDVTGVEPSHLVRMGSEDMTDWVALNVFDLIDAEIGWTIDTGDWIYMSEDDIYDVLMSVKPGAIVRMHDGGSDQSTTVAALKKALPKLAKQGYSFVTLDELLEHDKFVAQ